MMLIRSPPKHLLLKKREISVYHPDRICEPKGSETLLWAASLTKGNNKVISLCKNSDMDLHHQGAAASPTPRTGRFQSYQCLRRHSDDGN